MAIDNYYGGQCPLCGDGVIRRRKGEISRGGAAMVSLNITVYFADLKPKPLQACPKVAVHKACLDTALAALEGTTAPIAGRLALALFQSIRVRYNSPRNVEAA